MAKSLGQIHTINKNFTVNTASEHRLDIPAELSQQLQRMVRCGNFFKLVGMDLTLDNFPAGTTAGTLSGRMLYYAPTRGRCAAFRGAFKAVADVMKLQGISMRDNPLYDFTVPLNDVGNLTDPHRNQATLDGVEGLSLRHNTEAYSIFGVHNASVRPVYTDTAAELYAEGFNTILQAGQGSGTDFVLNDAVPFTGSPDYADDNYESIPFTLTWDPTPGAPVVTVEWRPDPALYLAVLCGQVVFQVDQFEGDFSLALNVSLMVSGWKSIMGNPDTKRKSMKRGKSMPQSS